MEGNSVDTDTHVEGHPVIRDVTMEGNSKHIACKHIEQVCIITGLALAPFASLTKSQSFIVQETGPLGHVS